jgi:hypothetical protein
MGNRNAAQSSLLPRVTFWMSVAAGTAEAAAIVIAGESVDFATVASVLLLAVPFGILAWMSRRHRDSRILKPLLFLSVLCLAAWGLSQLVDEAWPSHHAADAGDASHWAPLTVVFGNWIAVAALWWTQSFLSRFSQRKR